MNNQREIKFRVVQKYKTYLEKDYCERILYPVITIDFEQSQIEIPTLIKNTLNTTQNYTLDFKNLHRVSLSKYILMQFTGLKDKNGKEVFEGDIVRIWVPGEVIKKYGKQICKVIWGDGGFVLDTPWAGLYSLGKATKSRNKLEVIGDIYENSNLLKND